MLIKSEPPLAINPDLKNKKKQTRVKQALLSPIINKEGSLKAIHVPLSRIIKNKK